jgi:hypothetical protein
MMSDRSYRRIPAFRLGALLLTAAFALVFPASLRADTVTYNLTPTDTLSTDNGSVTGSFSLNTVTEKLNAIIVADGITFTCNSCALLSPNGFTTDEGFQALGPGGSYVLIGWARIPSLPSFLLFDPAHSYCQGCTANFDFFTAGDSAVSTPEPGSALLLISGLAALPFLRRRRSDSQ